MFVSREIEISKEDLRKIIYFILMKFRSDPLHLQGTSSKRDLIGAYIERWFNKVAETTVINHILKDKPYRVVGDFFLYGNDSEKNAPDILGLELGSGKNIPFVKYKNGTWVQAPTMPRIEVKVIRKDQMLLGVREPQMIDDYYVFIESDLEPDYLTAIFEEEVFKDKYFTEVSMPSDFIEEDLHKQIISHQKMNRNNKIGTMRLSGVYTKQEIRENTTFCAKKVSPYYFFEAVNVDKVYGKKPDGNLRVKKGELVEYINNKDKSAYLPFSIEGNGKKIPVLKRNKGSVYIESDDKLVINGNPVNPGLVKIGFKKFERSSNWDENLASKYTLMHHAEDVSTELFKRFDEIAERD